MRPIREWQPAASGWPRLHVVAMPPHEPDPLNWIGLNVAVVTAATGKPLRLYGVDYWLKAYLTLQRRPGTCADLCLRMERPYHYLVRDRARPGDPSRDKGPTWKALDLMKATLEPWIDALWSDAEWRFDVWAYAMEGAQNKAAAAVEEARARLDKETNELGRVTRLREAALDWRVDLRGRLLAKS